MCLGAYRFSLSKPTNSYPTRSSSIASVDMFRSAGRAGHSRFLWASSRYRMASNSTDNPSTKTSSCRMLIAGSAVAATLFAGYSLLPGNLLADIPQPSSSIDTRPSPLWALPSRAQMLQALKESSAKSIRPNSNKQTNDDEFLLNQKAKNTKSSASSPHLAQNIKDEEQLELNDSRGFDLLIIGGGATGTGVAVDATTRGLSVALVEKDDFGAGECPWVGISILSPLQSC